MRRNEVLRPSIAVRSMLFALVVAVLLVGCEDPIPTDYIPQNVVTAYLIVDEPIRDITVTRSLSVVDSFDYQASAITDAQVRIYVGDRTLDLAYRTGGAVGDYYYPDTTELVLPNTKYRLEIRTSDGSVMTGETVTPERVSWVTPPRDTLQYPLDTINLPAPDSLGYEWSPVPGVTEFILSSSCLDTLGYGTYLTPPTEEKNRRIENIFNQRSRRRYDETTRWGFAQSTNLPVFWFAYKWFGLYELSIYAPDPNMIEWFKQTRFGPNQYNPLLGSIKGEGIGVFGSASVVRQRQFLLKNQP